MENIKRFIDKIEISIDTLIEYANECFNNGEYRKALDIYRQCFNMSVGYDNLYYINKINRKITECEIKLLKDDRNIINVIMKDIEGK